MLLKRTKSDKARLQHQKTIKIGGSRFVIKKLNPLLDFTSENMPQVFTSYISRRKVEPIVDPHKIKQQILSIIEAAVIEPQLVPVGKGELRGKEGGITVEDIFRDQETAYKLYWEIMIHSLVHLKGLAKLFFWIETKLLLLTPWQKDMGGYQVKLSSITGIVP